MHNGPHQFDDADKLRAALPPIDALHHGPFGPSMHGRGPWGGPWGGGRRARRGDIRSAVLRLLSEGPMHGYQIIQELSNRSGGHWQPSPGSVDPTLQLLEDEGLISGSEVEGKRVYELTDKGRDAVKELADTAAPWDQVAEGEAGSPRGQLRSGMGKLAAAVMQAAGSASDDQATRIVEILTDARKKIYTILAED